MAKSETFACCPGSCQRRYPHARLSLATGRNTMNSTTLLLGAYALVALPMGTAAAGQCTTEIENMTKLLASRDAGAGPTAGAASPTTGQHLPSAAMSAADPSTAASSATMEYEVTTRRCV